MFVNIRICGVYSVIFVNFYIFFNSDVIMTTCQLSAQKIVNWVTTADGCVHTADATRLDSFVSVASAVCIGNKEFKTVMHMAGKMKTLKQKRSNCQP